MRQWLMLLMFALLLTGCASTPEKREMKCMYVTNPDGTRICVTLK